MSITQEINFVGKLEEDDGTFFLSLKSSKNYSKLFFKFISCNRIIKY